MPGLYEYGNWNDINLNTLLRIKCRESMVTAAEIITYPTSYIKVVAVKDPVVGLLVGAIGLTLRVGNCIVHHHLWGKPVWH